MAGSARFTVPPGMVIGHRQATALMTEQAVVTPCQFMGYGRGGGGGGWRRGSWRLGLMAGGTDINRIPGMVSP